LENYFFLAGRKEKRKTNKEYWKKRELFHGVYSFFKNNTSSPALIFSAKKYINNPGSKVVVYKFFL